MNNTATRKNTKPNNTVKTTTIIGIKINNIVLNPASALCCLPVPVVGCCGLFGFIGNCSEKSRKEYEYDIVERGDSGVLTCEEDVNGESEISRVNHSAAIGFGSCRVKRDVCGISGGRSIEGSSVIDKVDVFMFKGVGSQGMEVERMDDPVYVIHTTSASPLLIS